MIQYTDTDTKDGAQKFAIVDWKRCGLDGIRTGKPDGQKKNVGGVNLKTKSQVKQFRKALKSSGDPFKVPPVPKDHPLHEDVGRALYWPWQMDIHSVKDVCNLVKVYPCTVQVSRRGWPWSTVENTSLGDYAIKLNQYKWAVESLLGQKNAVGKMIITNLKPDDVRHYEVPDMQVFKDSKSWLKPGNINEEYPIVPLL